MSRQKVAIVGCGDVAAVHAAQYYSTESSTVDLVACVDTDAGRRDRFARQFGITDAYSDFRSVLDRDDILAVDLCTPPSSHPSLIVTAAEAGKHVISEKPLGVSYAESAAAVDKADSLGVRVGVIQNYRWRPEYMEAQATVAGGSLGKPLMAGIEGMFHWNGTSLYRRQTERMLVIEMTVHYIDLLRYVLGSDVINVYAQAGRPEHSSIKGETFAALILTFANGAIGTILNSGECWGADANWGGESTIQLEEGTIYLNRRSLFAFDVYSPAWGGHTRSTFPPERYGANTNASFAPPLKAFYEALESGADLPVSARDNLQTLATVLAAYQSIETSQSVQISDFVTAELARR